MDGESCIKKAYEAILDGDYEQAIGWFEEAIELEPDHASHHYKCSITCLRSGKTQKALYHAERAAALDPASDEFRFQLQTVQAKLLVREVEALLGKTPPETDRAIEKLKYAAMLDPLNVEVLLLLGATYASLKRYEEAAEYAQEAMKLDPHHSAAQRLLADVNRKMRGTFRTIIRKKRR